MSHHLMPADIQVRTIIETAVASHHAMLLLTSTCHQHIDHFFKAQGRTLATLRAPTARCPRHSPMDFQVCFHSVSGRFEALRDGHLSFVDNLTHASVRSAQS
jgi:hypothetical protein